MVIIYSQDYAYILMFINNSPRGSLHFSLKWFKGRTGFNFWVPTAPMVPSRSRGLC